MTTWRSPPETASKALPLISAPQGEQGYLVLYGTGISGSPMLESVVLTLGGAVVPVTSAGPQGQFSGLDQINAGPLPRSLQGRGVVDAILTVNGKTSNRVELRFR
jgi:uncharacterized protein (TIGR03437 family)